MAKSPVEALAFLGEQVLSFLDEVTRMACPRCKEQNLSPTIVGTDLVIRCSEILQMYNVNESSTDIPIISDVCDYVQVIRKTSVQKAPFNLMHKDSRATSNNIPKARRRRGPKKRTS